jgi:hypothetical protein
MVAAAITADGWNTNAHRQPMQDAGAFAPGFRPRLVWHTTQGTGWPDYKGGTEAPHFTINPKTGELRQHMSVLVAARALRGEDVAGIATNRAHAIQVEIIGFAGDSDTWPESYYENLRELAAWIEVNCGVRSTCSVTFTNEAHPMSHTKWEDYEGHCGHQHVPGQDHFDPGEFRIEEVLANREAFRNLKLGDHGDDVKALQRAVNKRALGCCRSDHTVTVDGVYGEATKAAAAFVAYILGIGDSQADNVAGGLSANIQNIIRHPRGTRNETQLDRALARREKHCHCTR